MGIIIFGVLILIIGFVLLQQPSQYRRYGKQIIIAGVIVMLAGALSTAIVQIGPGEVGVQTLFGKVQGRTLTSGLNVVNPLVKVVKFDIRTQNYTMSGLHSDGENMSDDAIRVLSADGLEVVIDLTVLYKIQPAKAPEILSEIGTEYRNIIIRPLARTKIRDNAAYYDAVALYSAKRDEFQQRIFTDIEDDFKRRGIILEQLLIRNIALPQAVKTSIESKIQAEQESQKMQFVLSKEKQEADRKRVEAQGIADYQKIINSELTDKLLQYEMIKANKEIATSENAKVIIMNGKGNVPIILGDK